MHIVAEMFYLWKFLCDHHPYQTNRYLEFKAQNEIILWKESFYVRSNMKILTWDISISIRDEDEGVYKLNSNFWPAHQKTAIQFH